MIFQWIMAVSHECSGSTYLSVIFLLTRSFRRLMKKVQVLNKYNIIWCFPENYRKPFSGIFLKRFWNCCTLKSPAVTYCFLGRWISWMTNFYLQHWTNSTLAGLLKRTVSLLEVVFLIIASSYYTECGSQVFALTLDDVMVLLTPGARFLKVPVN